VNFRQPPRLAVWLLRFLRVSVGNEPLVGDLLEEFRNGRTAGWYWRQAFMAMVTTFGQRFRAYRQYLLAMLVGWFAESSVVAALWILRIPLGPHFLVLGVSGLASIWLVLYVEYRVRVHQYQWRNDDSSEEESDELWEQVLSPRIVTLWSFGYFVLNDAICVLLGMFAGQRIQPALYRVVPWLLALLGRDRTASAHIMKGRNPPALAVWLLNRLGISAGNEPLAGDLLEEYRSGRTAAWYWRQTLMAILTALVRRVSELRLGLQVLYIGWAAQGGFLLTLRWLRVPIGPGSFVLGLATLMGVSLVCYASMEITARTLISREDLSAVEFGEQLGRTVYPRVIAVGWFAIFMFVDGWIVMVMKIASPLERDGFPSWLWDRKCGLVIRCFFRRISLDSVGTSWRS
jgi:hypothetical protein